MGTMSFLLPSGLTPEAAQELERSCIAGGPDSMPWPTEAQVEADRLLLVRDVDESGALVAPWQINDLGRLMGTSGTLMERSPPYQFLVELARGKINQVRSQAADWQAGGLQIPAELNQQVLEASIAFGRAVTEEAPEAAQQLSQQVLESGYRAADELVRLYIEQMFQARHQRQPRLDTTLGCRVGGMDLAEPQAESLMHACNSIDLTFAWSEIEREEGKFSWDRFDRLLDWAEKQGLAVTAGPLIDFAPSQLPEWIWFWERDLGSLSSFMSEYVETVVKRYHERIKTWQLTTASNNATVLALGEDELLWLTVRLAEAARQIDPNISLIVGVSQPWGEYMAVEDRTHSPFIFADTLIRSGLNLAGLDIEIVMGVMPYGSYCRDLLETSRVIDLYTLLGVPLRVTMACPSSANADEKAISALQVNAGHWRSAYSPENQAEWAALYTALALCKPSVRGVHWAHLSDAAPHQFPHCGLFDTTNQPKPVIKRLQELRENHLR